MSDAIDEGMEALREIEVAWLSRELGRAISNLAYPVGCGAAPTDYHLESAAKALFERYAKMIEMAARNARTPQESDR